ncbi:MAG: gluconate transporter [Ignavibacteria bacterium GWB2_35_6b]|nr:MAG: gluconate transporter [Ignavibacteria bacterium GWB2_35_6b]
MATLIYLAVVIVLLVFATVKFKLHPFLSLIIASLVIGFITGQESSQLIITITEGFGSTLKSIGFIIAFGTIIGVYLEKSGGAKTMAETVLKIIGEKKSALAMNLTGYIVSIPVFCDSGFIILSSLNKALSKRTGIPLAVLAVALGTGLYATHVFVPPTPGPLAAAATLNADIGLVIIYGLIVGLVSALSGLLWAKYSCRNVKTSSEDFHVEEKEDSLPNKVNSFAPILLPIILIALKSIADYPTQPLGDGFIKSFISFCGNPVIALFIGVGLSFSLKKEKKNESHFDWVNEGLKSAGTIILITGAGGAFGNVLRATDLGDTIGNSLSTWNVGILLPFLIAALLKTAQGSSTVAIITTAAIISPLLSALGLESETAKALTVLAIGAGSMTVSHINDSYFWVVSQFSGMDTSSALKTHTVATFVQGIAGIIIIAVLLMFFK